MPLTYAYGNLIFNLNLNLYLSIAAAPIVHKKHAINLLKRLYAKTDYHYHRHYEHHYHYQIIHLHPIFCGRLSEA